MKTTLAGSVIQALNTEAPATITPESVYWHLEETTGSQVSKVVTLSVSGGTQSLNCFQLTGTVEVLRLYAEITSAATLVNCTNVFFELYDSAASVDITKSVAGAVLSGLAVGTFLVKDAAAGVVLAVADNADGAVTEGSSTKIFDQFFVTQKIGENTYVRLTYTSTDAPIAATIKVYCDYIRMGSGTLVVV